MAAQNGANGASNNANASDKSAPVSSALEPEVTFQVTDMDGNVTAYSTRKGNAEFVIVNTPAGPREVGKPQLSQLDLI